MRRLSALLVVVVAFLATAVGGFATATGHKVTPKPKPICAVIGININKTTGIVATRGYCRVGERKVTVRWFTTVTRYDSQANVCGSKPVTGKNSTLKLDLPGAFKLVFTVRTATKWYGRFYRASKVVQADLGGDKLQCARLTTPPDPSAVCDWGTRPAGANPNPSSPYCGDPVPGAPAWLSKPELVDRNTVSAGRIGSASGACVFKPLAATPSSAVWQDATLNIGGYFCSDGVILFPAMFVTLAPPNSQARCQVPLPLGGYGFGLMSITFPSDWGGTAYITAAFKVQQLPSGGPGVGQSAFSDAIIQLRGTVDGCAALGLPTY